MERNKEKNFISVVLYLYNKEQEISVFLPKLYAMLEDNLSLIHISFITPVYLVSWLLAHIRMIAPHGFDRLKR